MAESDFIRCSLRVPQSLYEKIEAIAIANNAKINSRSKRPQISPTLIELLCLGLERYSAVDSAISEDSTSVSESTEKSDLKLTTTDLNQILEHQQQSQQTIEQQLGEIQTNQQFTSANITHLYHLVSQLCDYLNSSANSQTPLVSSSQLVTDKPIAASLDQWTVNHQWLCANACFSEESFDDWKNGEVRQDKQGRYWRRIELATVLGDFEIPSDLTDSQIFYVLEYNY
ncbi:MAG: hypothetical protein WBA13_16450 [Microcoleaceae cyanobacterium]